MEEAFRAPSGKGKKSKRAPVEQKERPQIVGFRKSNPFPKTKGNRGEEKFNPQSRQEKCRPLLPAIRDIVRCWQKRNTLTEKEIGRGMVRKLRRPQKKKGLETNTSSRRQNKILRVVRETDKHAPKEIERARQYQS